MSSRSKRTGRACDAKHPNHRFAAHVAGQRIREELSIARVIDGDIDAIVGVGCVEAGVWTGFDW
jgi:hypothetical protein